MPTYVSKWFHLYSNFFKVPPMMLRLLSSTSWPVDLIFPMGHPHTICLLRFLYHLWDNLCNISEAFMYHRYLEYRVYYSLLSRWKILRITVCDPHYLRLYLPFLPNIMVPFTGDTYLWEYPVINLDLYVSTTYISIWFCKL